MSCYDVMDWFYFTNTITLVLGLREELGAFWTLTPIRISVYSYSRGHPCVDLAQPQLFIVCIYSCLASGRCLPIYFCFTHSQREAEEQNKSEFGIRFVRVK